MSSVAVATATAVGGAYSAYQAGEAADADRALSREQMDAANRISERELEMAEEQWQMYVDNILPLEMEAQQLGIDARQLAQQRGELDFQIYEDFYAPMNEQFAQMATDGVTPRYEEVARDAAATVDQNFAQQRDMTQRSLERKGVRPDAGLYQGAEEQLSHAQAAARSHEMNKARENETQRVENTGFNRVAVALGRSPGGAVASQSSPSPQVSPASAANLMGSAGSQFNNSSQFFQNSANRNSANAANALSGGITAGANIYSAFRPQQTPAMQGAGWNNFSNLNTGQDFSGGGTGFGGYAAGSNAEWANFADGGPVLSRGMPGGKVNGPPGNDNVPAQIDSPDGKTYDARLTDGEYVIPVDVVMAKGTEFFDKLLDRHHKPSGQKALSRGNH